MSSFDFGISTIPSASLEGESTLSAFMIEVRQRLGRLEAAHVQIANLKTALAESESARHALEAELAAISSHAAPTATTKATTTPNVAPNDTHAPKLATSAPNSTPTSATTSPGTPNQSSFTLVESKKSGKKRKNKPATPPTPNAAKASATIARLFGPQSDLPSGYQFVYFSTPVRRRLSAMRSLIQAVNLNNSRVLDIQYPVQNVISFLVHNDYVLPFTKTMHQHGRGCSPLLDFDPCDPQNLKDPQFASLTPDLRQQKANEIENLRCLRALSFVRRSVRLSVARSFLHYDRINQKQFDAILSEELKLRSASSAARPTSKSSDEERLAKKQRLSYLGYLLHHDHETASLLAYPATDSAMADSAAV